MEDEKKERLEVDFLSTSGVYKTPFSFIILVQLLFGGIICILINLWFYNHLYVLLTGSPFYSFDRNAIWWEWLLLPLNVYSNIFLFSFVVIIFSGIIYKIINWYSPIHEGEFKKDSKEWKFMHRRFWTAYFPIWLVRALPLPWLDIACYRLFGVKIGRTVVAYEGYIDPALVEIGNQTMTSLHVCIFSHLIYHDKVIIKKIKVGQNCIVGPNTILFPGTIMEDGAILGANSYTNIGQRLKSNLIHIGRPVDTTLSIQTLEESKNKLERIVKKSTEPQLKELEKKGDV